MRKDLQRFRNFSDFILIQCRNAVVDYYKKMGEAPTIKYLKEQGVNIDYAIREFGSYREFLRKINHAFKLPPQSESHLPQHQRRVRSVQLVWFIIDKNTNEVLYKGLHSGLKDLVHRRSRNRLDFYKDKWCVNTFIFYALDWCGYDQNETARMIKALYGRNLLCNLKALEGCEGDMCDRWRAFDETFGHLSRFKFQTYTEGKPNSESEIKVSEGKKGAKNGKKY